MPAWGECPIRRQNQAFALAYWERVGVPVVLGSGAARAHSVNAAARAATREHPDRDVWIIADNDLIPDPVTFPEALERVRDFSGVTPHNLTRLTTPGGRARALRGAEPHAYRDVTRGSRSFVVITRRVYDSVNGMDELFVGWGPEDRAFIHSVEAQVGPMLHLNGTRLHLWHPVDPSMADRKRLHRNRMRMRYYARATREGAARLAREYGRWNEPDRSPEEHGGPAHDPGERGRTRVGAGRHAARPGA
jgi:hypothetical protein